MVPPRTKGILYIVMGFLGISSLYVNGPMFVYVMFSFVFCTILANMD